MEVGTGVGVGGGVTSRSGVKKVRGVCTGGGLVGKIGTAASVFNLQTGARKRRVKKGPRALAVRFKDRLLQTLLHLCAQKKRAANTEEFTVG